MTELPDTKHLRAVAEGAFELDTSGVVRLPLGSSGGETETALYRWHNLSPFEQGFIRAALESIGAHYQDLHSATLARFLRWLHSNADRGVYRNTLEDGARLWCACPFRLSPDPDGKIIIEEDAA